jgi:hypothetical protein
MNDFHPTDDLDWQAFAYWADELSPADRLEFEQRLADEQTAREALARVVELSQAVIVAESLVTPSSREAPPRRSRRTLGWVAAIAASVLAMVAGFMPPLDHLGESGLQDVGRQLRIAQQAEEEPAQFLAVVDVQGRHQGGIEFAGICGGQSGRSSCRGISTLVNKMRVGRRLLGRGHWRRELPRFGWCELVGMDRVSR